MGYRVKSKNATQFRSWATARLKDYLRSGVFLFVDFLHRNRRLLRADGEPVINDTSASLL